MITVIATLKVKAGQEETLVAGMKKMIEHVRAHEPGTRTYLLHRSAADATTFLVYEVYADQAAFAAHGASEPMKEFFKLAGGILDGRPDIAMYEEIDGKR
jgi:(4S)-4-hydroxy-5-phosphonooxypentane-2,3-dione isomerase